MTDRERIAAMVAAIRRWPPEEQARWRELLEAAPAEAMVMGELALLLDARPVDEDDALIF